jgi:hypothetical protein
MRNDSPICLIKGNEVCFNVLCLSLNANTGLTFESRNFDLISFFSMKAEQTYSAASFAI